MKTSLLKLLGITILLACLPFKAIAAEDAMHKIVIQVSTN